MSGQIMLPNTNSSISASSPPPPRRPFVQTPGPRRSLMARILKSINGAGRSHILLSPYREDYATDNIPTIPLAARKRREIGTANQTVTTSEHPASKNRSRASNNNVSEDTQDRLKYDAMGADTSARGSLQTARKAQQPSSSSERKSYKQQVPSTYRDNAPDDDESIYLSIDDIPSVQSHAVKSHAVESTSNRSPSPTKYTKTPPDKSKNNKWLGTIFWMGIVFFMIFVQWCAR